MSMSPENSITPENYNPGVPARDLRRRPVEGIRAEDIGAFSVSPYAGLEGLPPEEREDSLAQAREDVATHRMYERGDYDPELERLTSAFIAAGEMNIEKAEEDARFALQTKRKSFWTSIKGRNGKAISGEGVNKELRKVKDRIYKYSRIFEQESQRDSEDNETAQNAAAAAELWSDIEDMVESGKLPAVKAAIDGT